MAVKNRNNAALSQNTHTHTYTFYYEPLTRAAKLELQHRIGLMARRSAQNIWTEGWIEDW